MESKAMHLPSPAEYEALRALCETHKPLYGLQITAENPKVKISVVYKLLENLEKKNLVYVTGKAPSPTGPDRTLYRPTVQGKSLWELCESFPNRAGV